MMKNADVFLIDPTTYSIPNNGVAQVIHPHTPQEWDVLRYELSHFVCEGEYERGLQLILSTYIDNLNKTKQPAVWVSGFYGSGKSHFVRVLEYLWRDTEFPEGVRARSLATLPSEISDLLKELSTMGKREGGLWSAAGTLNAGTGKSVRLALLSIMFRSADLPEQYAPARFVIWLMQNGFYRDVKASVEQQGKEFATELNNMYVSPILAKSLLDVYPEFARSAAEARGLLKAQYPPKEEISDDELLQTMGDVLDLQTTTPGKRPCVLLIFDELQQFIGDDSPRTLQVQNVVEACSSRFGNQLLFVATGQASIQATPQLQKLQGRFTIRVTLSDTDVERVVREVVLRKKPAEVPTLQAMFDNASGEINRHLAGTKIGPQSADAEHLIPDYPLLPVRSRFWERVLRAVDSMGTAGQLRTQLRIVHDTLKEIAYHPLGTVVTGDIIYYQLKTDMLQSNVLLRDMSTMIDRLNDGTPEGRLCSRICAAIFLIGKLPPDGPAATGLRANMATLADLLVDNIVDVSANSELRQSLPLLLQNLVEKGTLMQVGEEYRLQTRESAEWETDYQRRRARIRADDARVASDRKSEFQTMITAALKGISVTQGVSKTARKHELFFGNEAPSTASNTVPVWIRDEWSLSEKAVREDAQAAGVESPIVFVFLPQMEADALKDALAGYAAAQETIQSRPTPGTPEGLEAKRAMESKRQLEQDKRTALIKNIIDNARIYQGGGNEIAQGSLQASVRTGIEAAVERLFPRFKVADHTGWGNVVSRTQQGAKDALTAIGYQGDIDKCPPCQEIRTFIGVTGKKGSDIRKQFTGAGYGWPQDAVDGALLCLVAGEFVRAVRNAQPQSVKLINMQNLGQTDFYSEGVTITTIQRIGLRKLFADLGFSTGQNEEAEAVPRVLDRLLELARKAGGEAPLPECPSTASIEQLRALNGNEQLLAVYEQRESLLKNFQAWTRTGQKIAQRLPQWTELQRLFHHACNLPVASEVAPQREAVISNRTFLQDPDPVRPLLNQVCAALRQTLLTARQRLEEAQKREIQSLETSQEWSALPQEEQARLLQEHGLSAVPLLVFSTNEELLATLDATPIANWEDKIAAPRGRVLKVREEMAKRNSSTRPSQFFTPPPATLHTAEEVHAYLTQLREELLARIEAGYSVTIM